MINFMEIWGDRKVMYLNLKIVRMKTIVRFLASVDSIVGVKYFTYIIAFLLSLRGGFCVYFLDG